MYARTRHSDLAHPAALHSKIESLKARIMLLTGLKKVVAGTKQPTFSKEQWFAINNQLETVANKLMQQLSRAGTSGVYANTTAALADQLGALELELSQAFGFYDTYMDILTQRLSPELGSLLRGCDAIAADGLKYASLTDVTRNPVVYCDRGFGASILREGVTVSGTANPVAFIAIPYSRLAEKYNLISIYHEVGHQAMSKLNLVDAFQRVFATVVKEAGGNTTLQSMFANWSKEVVPDFWAFAHTGMAQTASLKDILLVPQNMAFGISAYQQHPPSYLRFLFSVAWCRYLWGRGEWDEWESEWETLYPLHTADELTKANVRAAKKFVHRVAVAVITTRFRHLNRKPLTHFLDMDVIAPHRLRYLAAHCSPENLRREPVGLQLGAFRLLRENHKIPIQKLNAAMRTWLTGLALK